MPDARVGQSIDPDPLLEFTTELPRVDREPTPSPADPLNPAPASAPIGDEAWRSALQSRVAALEQRLSQSSTDVVSLRSEIATLVTAANDIKQRMRRREAAAVPDPPIVRSRATPIAIAIACVTIGVFLAGVLWLRFSAVELPPPVTPSEAQGDPPANAPIFQPVGQPLTSR